MNKTSVYLIVGSLLLIIGIVLGFPWGFSCKKLPDIKVGKDTVLISVVVHDTLHDTIPITKFKTYTQVDTVKEAKKSNIKDSVKVADTVNCLSFDKTYPDKAYIKASICSSLLPKVKPFDLSGEFTYLPKPDSTKIVFQVDTISRFKTTPFYRQPMWWIGLAAGCVGGYFVGHSIH
jgi:hypothetical protein